MITMKVRMKKAMILLPMAGAAALCAAQGQFNAEAARHNNRGVALMGQQFTERAAGEFTEAVKDDPKLVQAQINEGIALMEMQKLPEARKALESIAPEQVTEAAQELLRVKDHRLIRARLSQMPAQLIPVRNQTTLG